MGTAKAVAAACFAAMATVLAYAFTQGDFRREGAQIIRLPWGIVSLVDAYVGFTFFSAWIAFRERSLARTVPLVAAVMVLGNVFSAGYAFWAAASSGGSWRKFWLGNRAGEE